MGLESFTYDEINSLDYGMYVTQKTVWDAPKRVVSMIQVAGRNGDLTIDEGKYENVRVRYTLKCNATTKDEFAEKVKLFRNELCSRTGYKRLTDTYNQGEYRMGVFITEFSVNGQFNNTAGVFDVEFNCKPQRFLTSGETARSIPEWSDMHTDSGSLVTIGNSSGEYAVKSLSAGIVPQQDLNGYDNPWAGGAGKNKLKNTATSTTINNVVFTVNADGSVTANGLASANAQLNLTIDTSNVYGDLYFNCAYNGSGTTYDSYMWDNTASARCKKWNGTTNSSNGYKNLEEIKIVQGHTTTLVIRVYSGYNANNVKFYPMICSSTETETTFAPYENICPITGFSSTNVTRAGKNLLPPYSTSGGTSTSNGITFTYNSNGSITASGTATANALAGSPSGFRLPPGTYKKNAYDSTKKVGLLVQKKVTSSNWVTVGLSTSDTFTLTEEDAQYELAVRMRVESGATLNSYNYTPIIRLPDTTDTSELYNGNTYSVSFGSAGTVYGGTLDVVTGALTVDRVSETLTSESQLGSVSTSASYGPTNKFYCQYETKRVNDQALVMCDRALSISFNERTSYVTNDRVYADTNTGSNLILRCSKDSTITTKTDFFNYWQGAQIVYTLATPLTYQLTATQVAFLLGTNNFWSNTGDIQIEYGKGGNTLYNPTPFDSLPLIKVTGTGTLGIGDWILTITGLSSQVLYIDCDMMEVYKNTGGIIEGANSLVSINKNTFPKLVPGMNNITKTSGLTSLKITPRWWRI